MRNKRNVVFGAIAILTFSLVLFVGIVRGSSVYTTIEALLNRIVAASSDGESFRVEFSNTVSDFTVEHETALTNTVDPTFTIQHTTTGSPANGIGTSMDFEQETTAGNNEIGARIAAVTTDVTAASEDFSLEFMSMAAGAAAATKLTMGSTGILTMAGGGTLDNTTSASELNLTETTVQLTGAVNMDAGTVTVNQDSADYDFVVESNGSANALVVDAGNDRVGVFTSTPSVAFDVVGATLITGATTINGAVVINETSADVDTRIESNDVTDALVVDAGLNTISHGTWDTYDYVKTTAQSYSLSSTGRAGNFIQTVGAAGTFHLMTELLTTPGPGAVITIKTGDTSDITIDTEGSETIDGAATYVLDGSYEAVTLTNDGSNWFILGGYLE